MFITNFALKHVFGGIEFLVFFGAVVNRFQTLEHFSRSLRGQRDSVCLAGGRVDNHQGVPVCDLLLFSFGGDHLCVFGEEQQVGLVNDVLLCGDEVRLVSVFGGFSEEVLGLCVFHQLFLFAEKLEGSFLKLF